MRRPDCEHGNRPSLCYPCRFAALMREDERVREERAKVAKERAETDRRTATAYSNCTPVYPKPLSPVQEKENSPDSWGPVHNLTPIEQDSNTDGCIRIKRHGSMETMPSPEEMEGAYSVNNWNVIAHHDEDDGDYSATEMEPEDVETARERQCREDLELAMRLQQEFDALAAASFHDQPRPCNPGPSGVPAYRKSEVRPGSARGRTLDAIKRTNDRMQQHEREQQQQQQQLLDAHASSTRTHEMYVPEESDDDDDGIIC